MGIKSAGSMTVKTKLHPLLAVCVNTGCMFMHPFTPKIKKITVLGK
jgi:hypothetical protein